MLNFMNLDLAIRTLCSKIAHTNSFLPLYITKHMCVHISHKTINWLIHFLKKSKKLAQNKEFEESNILEHKMYPLVVHTSSSKKNQDFA